MATLATKRIEILSELTSSTRQLCYTGSTLCKVVFKCTEQRHIYDHAGQLFQRANKGDQKCDLNILASMHDRCRF
jgi:hypothetical protein